VVDPFIPLELTEELLPGLIGPARTAEGRRREAARNKFVLEAKRGTMGFLSGFLNIGKKILGTFLGGGAPARALPRPVSIATGARRVGATRFGRAGRALAGAGALGGAFAVGETAVGGLLGGDGDGAGGNGRNFRRTIVLTIDSDTNEIVRRKVLAGAPHLMNRDLQIAKRVFRLSSKLHMKLPKRMVRQSRTKALTNQVVEQALQRAALPCPTGG